MTDQYNPLIQKYALLNSIPWRLVYMQIEQESSGNAALIQPGSGALGLMQLMPSSFPTYTSAQLLDPETNIRIGTAYLKECIDDWQSENAADERYKFGLASYNAGPGNILAAQKSVAAQKYPTDKWSCVGPALTLITGLNNSLQTNWYVWIIWENYTSSVTD